jgi:hypothetical protein
LSNARIRIPSLPFDRVLFATFAPMLAQSKATGDYLLGPDLVGNIEPLREKAVGESRREIVQ